MYVYVLIEERKRYLLDDHGFVLDETHDEKLHGVWTYKADCRDEAIACIKADWLVASGDGCIAKSNGTIDTAIFDLRTMSHGRIVYQNPNEKEKYECQVEYVIKQVRLQ